MSHYTENILLLAENIINTRDTTRPEPEYLREPKDLARYLQTWNIAVAREPDVQDLADVLVLRDSLRSVFESHDIAVAVGILNDLLEGAQIKPYIGMAKDGNIKLELKVGEELPLARRLAVEASLELSAALTQYGIERFHICNATPCTEVFIDTSRNHSRRYCCEQCANRHNVAVYRKRQRIE